MKMEEKDVTRGKAALIICFQVQLATAREHGTPKEVCS